MDENIEYFTSLLPRLEGIYVHEVWGKIRSKIAKRIHVTCIFPSDWKDFVAELGINNPLVLEEIEVRAAKRGDLPLCVAFFSLLQYHCRLRDIIEALIRLERIDILCFIREDFEDFLEDWESRSLLHASTNNSHNYSSSTVVTEFNAGNVTKDSSCTPREVNSFPNLESHTEKQETEELSPSAGVKDRATADDAPSDYLASAMHNTKLTDVPVIKCACNYPKVLKVDIPKEKHCKFFSKTTEPIIVFVPYAQKTIATGIKFANRLREARLKVITISEAEFLISIDGSTFLMELLQKVDFVVPVISEDYMKYVRPSGNANKFNKDAKTNRFIFRWLHDEFENKNCYNFRVKPVIVEGFNKKLIEKEPIFVWAHQLWDEVERLIETLHKTKQMQDLMGNWNREEFIRKWMDHLNQN